MRRMIPLIAAVTLVAAVSIPVAVAAGSKAPPKTSPRVSQTVEGTWSWVNTASEVWKETPRAKYVSGSEDGTWTGTFEGTSVDAFGAKLWRHSAGGGIDAALNISFTGTVDGKTGTLQILTWLVRGEASSPWTIASGTGELATTRGYGTWAPDPETGVVTYTRIIKEYVPPTPSPSPSTSTSPSP